MEGKSALAFSWLSCGGLVTLGLLAKALWAQYGILCRKKRPVCDLGWPLLGHTVTMFREGLGVWGLRLMKGRAVVITNFLFSNVAVVSYPVYLKYLHKLEQDGGLTSPSLPSVKKLLGKKSVLMLPGGKGHKLHKRLRGKILATMGPKRTLDFLPMVLQLVRQTLDGLCETAAKDGYASFQESASTLAAKVSTLMITAGLSDEDQKKADKLMDEMMLGTVSVPLDLGPLTAFGRAMQARRQLSELIRKLVDHPNLEQQNIVRDLMMASEDGEAFDLEEVMDTTVTLLIAGKLTTSDALPDLLVQLSKHRDWAERVAKEPLEFSGTEEDSATLRVVRESMRLRPPIGGFRRACDQPLDLGEHGWLPAGHAVTVQVSSTLVNMGEDFNPDRWTPETSRDFLVFGGSQPHSCIGRHLAMLELQCFARVLCREYEFEVPDPTLDDKSRSLLRKDYKDGLRLTIRRKTQK